MSVLGSNSSLRSAATPDNRSGMMLQVGLAAAGVDKEAASFKLEALSCVLRLISLIRQLPQPIM
jgi:hypothetical protein